MGREGKGSKEKLKESWIKKGVDSMKEIKEDEDERADWERREMRGEIECKEFERRRG